MTTYIALLRGINVGGKNKLPMKDLTAMFAQAGCENVTAYIQSGNVVFKAESSLAGRIPSLIAGEIEKQFSFRVPVLLRTAEEMQSVVDTNPFLFPEVDTKSLHIVFLAEVPDSHSVARLDPDRSPPATFQVHGREIFLSCPNGLGQTRLTNDYFDSKLSTISTMRNWRTVLSLLEMASN